MTFYQIANLVFNVIYTRNHYETLYITLV